MQNLIEIFKKIISIDSPSGDERAMSEFIINFLKKLGLSPQVDKFGMVYCHIDNGGNPILFSGHMDTVEPGRGITAIEKDGYLRSEGNTILGGDNKANVAAILYTIQKLIIEKKEINIELLFSVREETTSGIRDFDYSKLKSKVGFVFDGGNGRLNWLVQQSARMFDFQVEIIGKSSHASRPEDGINALSVVMDLKDNLPLGRPDKYTTLNIGLINGGSSSNTVLEKVVIKGDLRSTNNDSFERIKNQFIKVIEDSAKKYNAKVSIDFIPYSFGYNLDVESPNMKKLFKLYESLGITLIPEKVTSGSDAGFLNHIGIETFCLGYGVQDVHTTNERIKIETFEKLQNIIETIMTKFN